MVRAVLGQQVMMSQVSEVGSDGEGDDRQKDRSQDEHIVMCMEVT